jgi:hypothetical protein
MQRKLTILPSNATLPIFSFVNKSDIPQETAQAADGD